MEKLRFKTVDEYLDAHPEGQRKALTRLRKMIHRLVPEAEEVISYNMPAYKYHGMLVGYAAFKNHCSLYMWKGGVLSLFEDDLQDFKTSEGTIQFTVARQIPGPLLERLILYRKEENLSKKK